MSGRVLALLAAAALLVAAPASAAVRATLTATTHTPKVGQAWRWTVVVTNASGTPVRAKARLQLVTFGMVVGCWKGGRMQQCSGAKAGDLLTFTGRKTGTIRWTAASRGVPLTLQAVVTAGGKTTKLRYAVKVT